MKSVYEVKVINCISATDRRWEMRIWPLGWVMWMTPVNFTRPVWCCGGDWRLNMVVQERMRRKEIEALNKNKYFKNFAEKGSREIRELWREMWDQVCFLFRMGDCLFKLDYLQFSLLLYSVSFILAPRAFLEWVKCKRRQESNNGRSWESVGLGGPEK